MAQGAACREDAKRFEDAVRRLAEALSEGVAFVAEGRIVWANDALASMAARAGAAGLALPELVSDLGAGLPDAARSPSARCGLRLPKGGVRAVTWRLAWPELAPGTD